MIGFEKLSGFRILIFCWDNSLIEGYYLNLLNEIAKHIEIFPVAIVTSLLSKLRLIKNGIHAFTYQELINFSLGSHKSTKVIRRRFSKAVLEDLSDYDRKLGWKWIPQENSPVKEFYLRQSSVILQAYDFLWRHFRPHMVMTWNGVALFQKALALLAHTYDVPVLFLERGLLPQTLYVDIEGVNYKSSLAGVKWLKNRIPYPDKKKIAMVKDYCQRLREGGESVVNIGKKTSVKEIKKKLNIRASSKVIFFPMQIEADSNVLYHSPHYSSMTEIIKEIQNAMSSFHDLILIIKPHPEDINRIDRIKPLINNNTYVFEDINLHSLLELADLVITVNSTVGLEALIFRKPVIVLGKAIYSEKEFTYDLLNRQDLPRHIEQALKEHDFNDKEFYRFLVHILEQTLFHLNLDQDYLHSRKNIAAKVVELIKSQRSGYSFSSKIMFKKLSDNIKLHKMCDKERVLILGYLDPNIESILLEGSEKQIKKIVGAIGAFKAILNSLILRNSLDLVLANSRMSFWKSVVFKLIRSPMKVLLGGNKIFFIERLS